MKKIILIILMLQTLFCFAEIADIQLSMNDNNVVLNDEFIVNLNTTNLYGLGIISFEISVNFDNSYLQFMEVLSEDTNSEGGFINSSISGGVVEIVGIFTQNLAGNGELINLKFKAINDGDTSLSYASALFNTTNSTDFSDGNVTITNAPTETMLSVGNYMEPNGTDFDVEILATGIAGKNCISFEFSFAFDDATLEYTGYSAVGTITENWTINSIGNANLMTFAGITSAPLTTDGILLKLQFSVLPSASEDCELNLQSVVLNTIEDVIIENGNFYIDTSVVLPPQNVSLSPLETGLRLSWNEVPNATYYEVSSASSPDGTFVIVQSGAFNQIGMKYFLDISPSENKGFYYIKACNDN